MRLAAARHGHAAAYHGVRVPGYVFMTSWWALIGIGRGTAALLSWWHVPDMRRLERQAAADGLLSDHLRIHKAACEVRTTRGLILAACAAVVVAALVILASAPLWAWVLLGLVALPLLARAGRPAGKPIVTAATLPATVQAPDQDVITRALGSLGIAGVDRWLRDGRPLVFSEPEGTIFVAAVCAATVFTIVLLARAYVVAWNQNALINAWAEQRPEAAVVWMLLGVIWVLAEEPRRGRHPTPRVVQVLAEEPGDDKVLVEEPGGDKVLVEEPGGDGTPTPLQRSGTARAILAKAAAAVNDYLPRLIDGGRPYSANAEAIASEAAAFLLDLRSAVNLPGGRVRKEDLAQLTKTVEDWSIGSLANLPRQASPAADPQESSSRRPGLLQVVRNVVVGTLPLILLIAVTLLPLKMSAPVTQALAPFAVTWLLLSVASIFAPADVKKNFIKNLPSR